MTITELLQCFCAARGGVAVVILELPDGQEIACTSEEQATIIEALWIATLTKVPQNSVSTNDA